MFEEALAALQQEEPDRDHILVSHEIDRNVHHILTHRLKKLQRAKECTLFLTTRGGDPHAAFRIARCLRHHYEHVRLAVPSKCKSAGTLLAVAADTLAIGDLGELGPLDIQVTKPSDVMERASGLDYVQGLQVVLMHAHQAFNLFMETKRGDRPLPTKQAAEYATNMTTGLVAPLYAQIDPTRIGEMQRAMQIAKEYGERLNEHANNLKPGALVKMVAEYPSHSFVIDRKEAKTLFHRVEPMTVAEVKLIDTLWFRFQDQEDLIHVCEPVPVAAPGATDAEPATAEPTAREAAAKPAEPSAGSKSPEA